MIHSNNCLLDIKYIANLNLIVHLSLNCVINNIYDALGNINRAAINDAYTFKNRDNGDNSINLNGKEKKYFLVIQKSMRTE